MKLVRNYLFTTIVSVAIVVLSTIPIPENPPLGDVPFIDKWVHFVMYAGLSLVMWVDRVWMGKKAPTKLFLLMAFLFPAVLGGLMELVQAYLTTCRSGDWIDFEADVVGALLGVICCILLDKLWGEKILARK